MPFSFLNNCPLWIFCRKHTRPSYKIKSWVLLMRFLHVLIIFRFDNVFWVKRKSNFNALLYIGHYQCISKGALEFFSHLTLLNHPCNMYYVIILLTCMFPCPFYRLASVLFSVFI